MLGLSVSIASTVVLIKNLADAGLAGTDGGRIATGWLIVEDLLTVVILVVLPVLFGPGEVDAAAAAMGLGAALAIRRLYGGSEPAGSGRGTARAGGDRAARARTEASATGAPTSVVSAGVAVGSGAGAGECLSCATASVPRRATRGGGMSASRLPTSAAFSREPTARSQA